MNKKEYLKELEKNLSGLPQKDIDERVEFYSEMIDDRIEEGKTEEEAIAEIGTIDEVVGDIAKDTSLVKLVSNKVKTGKRRVRPIEVILLILGFPLWFPLLLAFLVIVMAFFLVLWSLVIVTYALEVGLIGWAVMGVVMGFAQLADGVPALFSFGMSVACLGGSFVFIFVCILSTKLCFKLNVKVLVGIKRLLIGGKKNA